MDLHVVSESGSSIDQLGSDGVVLCGPLVRLEEPAEVRGALRFLVLRVRLVLVVAGVGRITTGSANKYNFTRLASLTLG